MKYLALLRGINVGGNNIIRMDRLRQVLGAAGFENVDTFIQSGNVIFESQKSDRDALTKRMESVLSKAFGYKATVVIRSYSELEKIVANVPPTWNEAHDLRCYVAFIKDPATGAEVAQEIQPHESVDELAVGRHVVYMSTKLDGLTKSKFNKIVGKKIYQIMTIRNYATTKKLLEMMEA